MKRILSIFALLLAAAGLSPAAYGATFEVCIMADVLTTDSNLTANGISEDYWQDGNDPVEALMVGRGFRVRVRQGAWVQDFDSHPDSGCFSFDRNSASGFDLRVYGFATDTAGNHVRIHDAQTDTSSWYPGTTYSALWQGQTLSSASPNTYVLDGRASDRWTTIAAAAFALRRYHDGNAGKTLSIGFNEGNCDSSTSIGGNSENYIESNNAHLIQIGRCASTSSDAREKMMVTHEQGHTMLRLYYGFDGDDAPRNQTYSPPNTITTDAPPQGPSCWNINSYTMNSLEWNSQAFKEAFADFYSARVWNVNDARATYVSRGTAYDLEFWDNVGETNPDGGFTENWCGSTANGVTTK